MACIAAALAAEAKANGPLSSSWGRLLRLRNSKMGSASITDAICEDSSSLPYWMLWHLALGVEHILVYDNDDGHLAVDAYDAALLRVRLELFLREGVATLLPFGGLAGAQMTAYQDGVQRAVKAGVAFLGALDTDKFLVPFADKCAPAWLKKCAGQQGCGAVQVNWRFSRSNIIELDHSKSLWSNLGFDVGNPNKHTKTFALAAAHERWLIVHNNQVRGAFHHVRDDGSRLSGASSGPFALPEVYAG
ncbi:hypothetical protein M885DRAFT_502208 [Pelagophyceae sp. CCMP2097]|nr:hypothetical protein M885DRAFT_502208 [Pelagophyceae sp. CCMP2097]